MEVTKLKLLIESELYALVLANSEDELAKITISTVREAIDKFIKRYNEELTVENINFLTEYIWRIIDKRKSKNINNKELEK